MFLVNDLQKGYFPWVRLDYQKVWMGYCNKPSKTEVSYLKGWVQKTRQTEIECETACSPWSYLLTTPRQEFNKPRMRMKSLLIGTLL